MKDILSVVMSLVETAPRYAKFLEEPFGKGFVIPAAYALPKLDALVASGIAARKAKAATATHAFEAVRVSFGDADRGATLDAVLAAVFGCGRDGAVALRSSRTLPGQR